MQKDYLGKSLLIITLATVGATALYAWTGATSNPPTENAYAPINIGGFKQIKTGDICTTFSGVEKCLSTVTGLVGPQGPKGDQGPAGGADGIGYGGTATGAVNMNFNNIGNIGTADIGVANIINANLSAFKLSTNPGLGKVLVSDNSGYGYWQTFTPPVGIPTGAVMYFNLSSCPVSSGWLPADGTSGTPDLRGEFIRGLDNGRGVDSGRTLASWQEDMFKSHTHSYTSYGSMQPQSGNSTSVWYSTSAGKTGATGGSETRPRNVALIACVKS